MNIEQILIRMNKEEHGDYKIIAILYSDGSGRILKIPYDVFYEVLSDYFYDRPQMLVGTFDNLTLDETGP